MLGELIEPGPLPRATVVVSGRVMTGVYVGETGGSVYLGQLRQLKVVPQRLISQLTIVSGHQKPAKTETILQRLQ